MEQFLRIKADHPDALVMFRCGDFYELFYGDAEIAARDLGITLTSRQKGSAGETIPMAGVPHHSAESYVGRLLEAGHRVAMAEQLEDPADVKGGRPVERGVVRVLTPGTLTDDALLDEGRENFLVGVAVADGTAGLAWLDVSTGRFLADDLPVAELADELARLDPAEVLVPEDDALPDADLHRTVTAACNAPVTPFAPWAFESSAAERCLAETFGVRGLDGFDVGDLEVGLRAAGALVRYLQDTHRAGLDHLEAVVRRPRERHMALDRATRRCLELVEPLRPGERAGRGPARGTLLWVLDRTRTPMGRRRLREWVLAPLKTLEDVQRRQGAVTVLAEDDDLRATLRGALREISDLERLLARVSGGRANPRDLKGVEETLRRVPGLREAVRGAVPDAAPADAPQAGALADLAARLDPCGEVHDALAAALVDEPPLAVSEGGIFRDGHHQELDELRGAARDGRAWMAEYQARESERTGIPSLKVGYNRVFGWYLEVTHAHADKVPDEYVRKQTLKNAERYITDELKEREQRLLTAGEKAKALERTLFTDLRDHVAGEVRRLLGTARALAELDALLSLADTGVEEGWTRPEIHDGPEITVEEGAHPVLLRTLRGTETPFVPNDIRLDGEERRLGVLTGPNMAGKSTYIRQAALLVLLAQIGSHVPARRARIGLADRIFTRVGAADELARGLSTFMVEMTETAGILHNATDRSLVILDEVGRGTSTWDGLAMAWAVTEHLHDRVRARTLFATHYHELTAVAEQLPAVFNLTVAVREWNEEIVFLHRIEDGAADRSYGIHVARLAGIPGAVVARARAILDRLEAGRTGPGTEIRAKTGKSAGTGGQGLLFDSSARDPNAEEVLKRLQIADPDRITPLDALCLLRELKDTLEGADRA